MPICLPQQVFGCPLGRWRNGRRGLEAAKGGRGLVNIRHYMALGMLEPLMTAASVTALPFVVLAGIIAISATRRLARAARWVNGLLNDIDRRISAIQVELEFLSKLPRIRLGDNTIIAYERDHTA